MRVALGVVVRGRLVHSAPFMTSTAPRSRFLFAVGGLVAVHVRTSNSEKSVLNSGDPRDFSSHAVFFTLPAAAMQQQ